MYNDATTIEDIYRFVLPAGTQILAGREYITRSVSWACSLRPSPPAFPKLDGNEFALIDMKDLQRLDPQMRLERVVHTLESARVAGIAVIGSVDQTAIQTALDRQMILMQLPDTMPLIQVERFIIRLIVDRAGYIAQCSAQLQRELNQIALDGGGLKQIAQHIYQFVQQPILILREDGEIITWVGLEGLGGRQRQTIFSQLPNITALRSWAASHIQEDPETNVDLITLNQRINITASGDPAKQEIVYRQIVVSPVIANEGVRGYCILLRPGTELANGTESITTGSLNSESLNSGLTAVERISATQGASAAALEWARQNAVDVAEERMRATFVDELLASKIADEQAWVQRGTSLGYDLLQPHVSVLAMAEGAPKWPHSFLNFLKEQSVSIPYSQRDEGVLLFWPVEHPKSGRELKGVMQDFVARFQQNAPQVDIIIGIGRPALEPSSWLRSQQQARESWRLGKEWHKTAVTYFGDLGLYQLLTNIADSHEAGRFFQQTLGRLIEHDKQHNGELIQTLEGFFVCHGNMSQTAKQLHIHRNTLTYRLERISEIARLDLNDPDARFSLNLALKLRPVVRIER